MFHLQRDDPVRHPFGASTLRRGLHEIEGSGVEPPQSQEWAEEGVDDDEEFEPSGLPPEYGLPPPKMGRKLFGPQVPSKSGIRRQVGSVRGTQNRNTARPDTPRRLISSRRPSIHEQRGRQAAERARGRERRHAEERQRRAAPSTPPGRPGAHRRRAPRLPQGFEQSLRRKLFRGWPENAIRYYLEQLTHQDEPGPARPNSREGILQDEAITFNQGQPREVWTAKKTLGRGGYGDVILWQRQRDDGVVDRLAVKNTRFDDFFRDYSSEAHLTRRLNFAGCKNVIEVYDWAALEKERRVRIIYEFYPLGDLCSTMLFYQDHRLVFPEHFLWHIFHNIATALCYCAQGGVGPQPKEGWEEIVHSDLKPPNILLDNPDPEVNPFYPNLRLADFGLAYTIPNQMIRDFKRQVSRGGTPGFLAPEMDPALQDDPRVAFPFPGTHSDVHSLGDMIRELMQCATARYPTYALPLLRDAISENWGWEYWPYSKELTLLVDACRAPDARDRPRPYDLYLRTKLASADMTAVQVSLERQARIVYAGRYFTEATVLYTREQQDEYMRSDGFRDAFARTTDWFHLHQRQFSDLCDAALRPWTPPPGYMAIGNGLRIARVAEYPNPQRSYVHEPGPRDSQITIPEQRGQKLPENIRDFGAVIQGGRQAQGFTGKLKSFFQRFRRTGR